MKERAYLCIPSTNTPRACWWAGTPGCMRTTSSIPRKMSRKTARWPMWSAPSSYLGTGFVSLKSKIRVRLISRNANDTFDATFWRRRVEYAWNYRKTVLEPADLSACRVIFGEATSSPA